MKDNFDEINDKFDKELKRRAQEEDFPLPEDYAGRVFAVCASLEEKNMEAKRKNNSHKWFIGIAAALAVFVAVPNVSMPAAQAMERIPLLGQVVEVITFRDYSADTDNTHIDVKIPQIEGDSAAAAAVNSDIEKYANGLIAQFNADCETLGEGYEGLDVSYAVTADTAEWFTLRVDATQTMASGYDFSKIYNIDKATGDVVKLGDLFADGSDWAKELDAEILRQMKDNAAKDNSLVYFPEEYTGITADRNFYFDGDGNLVVVFDEYEVAPGSMGEVEFTIDKGVFESLLK